MISNYDTTSNNTESDELYPPTYGLPGLPTLSAAGFELPDLATPDTLAFMELINLRV